MLHIKDSKKHNCNALTRKGEPCKIKIFGPQKKCWHHINAPSVKVEEKKFHIQMHYPSTQKIYPLSQQPKTPTAVYPLSQQPKIPTAVYPLSQQPKTPTRYPLSQQPIQRLPKYESTLSDLYQRLHMYHPLPFSYQNIKEESPLLTLPDLVPQSNISKSLGLVKTNPNSLIVKSLILTLRKGFPLYHMTYRRTEQSLDDLKSVENIPQYEALFKLKENEPLNDLVNPKYFSINSNHPQYYGADYKNTAALKYTTKKELKLIDIGDKHSYPEFSAAFDFRDYSQGVNPPIKPEIIYKFESQFDGWIGYDDIGAGWREIYLFHPNECVDHNYIDYENPLPDITTRYLWEADEIQDLKANLVESRIIELEILPETNGSYLLLQFQLGDKSTDPFQSIVFSPHQVTPELS